MPAGAPNAGGGATADTQDRPTLVTGGLALTGGVLLAGALLATTRRRQTAG